MFCARRHWIERLSRFGRIKARRTRSLSAKRISRVSRSSMKEGRKERQANRACRRAGRFKGKVGNRASSREPLHLRNLCEPWHRFRGAARVGQRLRYRRKADPPTPKTNCHRSPLTLSFIRADIWWVDPWTALYRALIEGNYFVSLANIFCALFSKDYLLRERRIRRNCQNFQSFSPRALIILAKIVDKTMFQPCLLIYFVAIFNPNYCARISLSRVGAREKAHSAALRDSWHGASANARVRATCSIYEQSRINHIELRTYPFGLSLSPIERECRSVCDAKVRENCYRVELSVHARYYIAMRRPELVHNCPRDSKRPRRLSLQ